MQKDFIRNGHTLSLLYNLMDTTNHSLKPTCLKNDSVNLLKCSGCTSPSEEAQEFSLFSSPWKCIPQKRLISLHSEELWNSALSMAKTKDRRRRRKKNPDPPSFGM
ncbi:hypothetical protein TNIN_102371 [Trichonephila inaurata madagascariensis]|uniref:Uncharacterized protein n=1 Tax=Trichonephila inaurata madagascariensis TaxID=2747483 RepID=A0A8X7CTT3_9ARAC|nr:hypothetical protein TNIN_102371 [Trichonephila inaurata madagascariensis]